MEGNNFTTRCGLPMRRFPSVRPYKMCSTADARRLLERRLLTSPTELGIMPRLLFSGLRIVLCTSRADSIPLASGSNRGPRAGSIPLASGSDRGPRASWRFLGGFLVARVQGATSRAGSSLGLDSARAGS